MLWLLVLRIFVRVKSERVALAFFGVNRSARYTIESIRKNIYGPLERAGVEYDVFFHTYNLKEIKYNPRADEIQVKLPGACELVDVLGPRLVRYTITDQDEFDAEIELNLLMKIKGSYSEVTTYQNICRQLESVRRVTNSWLLEANTTQYKAVVYLRPDLRYENEINVSQILNLESNQILSPYWHEWFGRNDRIAAAGFPEAARIWGQRWNYILEYTKLRPLHAEKFTKWVLEHRFHLEVLPFFLIAARVRADGRTLLKDTCLKFCPADRPRLCADRDCFDAAREKESSRRRRPRSHF